MKVCFVTLYLIIIFSLNSIAAPPPYKNECEVWDQYFCRFVGKDVYLKKSNDKAILGKIVGVAWKEKGDLIILDPPTHAPENSFYYVVDPGDGGDVFLISTKVSKPVK